MIKTKKEKISAKGFLIAVYTEDFKNDYISLTDIARYKNQKEPKDVVKNWLRMRDTIDFLGLWETIHDPNFKGVEFDSFRQQAGTNAFTLSPQRWIKSTNAIGIVSKSGRGGGTFAHSDIAMEFASWISAEFKLYIIRDYKRLKLDENYKLSLDWNLRREISKINYKIQIDAIKTYLANDLTEEQLTYKYASEADILNVALFNKTAKQWQDENPNLKGNIRDFASLNELLILANIESYNAVLITKGFVQEERMKELRKLAIFQLQSLDKINDSNTKNLTILDSKK
ncbi:MAG TPA: KilA-N domain-containing protein [Acholeplasma sp.]|nr:KilA-N domain-containing protein [Acholeplasma sp.]